MSRALRKLYGYEKCSTLIQGMSLVSFSDNFGQISLYQNYQLYWQYISKFKLYNPTKTTCDEKTALLFKKGLYFVVKGFWAENVQNLQFLSIQ